MRGGKALVTPPKGVLVGENVPLENQEEDFEEGAIEEMVAVLKTKEAYRGKSDDELREIAKEKLT